MSVWPLAAQPSGGAQPSYHAQRYAQWPDYAEATERVEAGIYQHMTEAAGDPAVSRGEVLVIPVVFHVMYLPEDSVPAARSSNIPDAQIMAGLAWLNDAVRNRGPYAGGPFYTDAGINSVDLEIEFCLAQTDPAGNPTNGIVRTSTPLSNLYREDPCPDDPNQEQDHCLRAASFWDSYRYMNIWLVNNICDQAGGNCDIEGYSLMVGSHGQLYDGPVLKADLWGKSPADQARLTRHIGHYLNLFDTYFQPLGPSSACLNSSCLMQGDRVCDTPPDAGPGAGDCAAAVNTLNSCTTDMQDTSALNPFRDRDVQDMYENFMDGGSGACKNTFTPLQKVRVRWALLNTRRSLLESGACVPIRTNMALTPTGNPSALRCDARTEPQIYAKNAGNTDVTAFSLRYVLDDGPAALQDWAGLLAPGDSVLVTLPAATLLPGGHLLRVDLTDVNGEGLDDEGADDRLLQSFFFLPSPVVADSVPYCATLEGGNMAPGWLAPDPDQVLGLDLYAYARCPDRGNYVIRYNSSGLWNNGDGPMADPAGTRDYLISPVFDLSAYREASLRFDLAYMAAASGRDLTLRVLLARSCGGEPVLLYEKSRFDLQTIAGAADTALVGWEPGGCEDWRQEEIDLDAFTGEPVFFIFELEVKGGYSQNLYLDNLCLSAGGACVVPAQIPHEPGLYVADNFCTGADGWTHYWKEADTEPQTEGAVLLFSLLDPQEATVLPPGEVQMLLTEGYGQGAYDLSETAPYVRNPKGWFAGSRTVYLNPQAQPADSVWVRLYFAETDVADLAATVPGSLGGVEDLVLYRLQAGLNPDPRTGHAGIEPGWFHEVRYDTVGSQQTWRNDPQAFGYAATLAVDTLGGLGLGSGGEGLGMGATYPIVPDLQGRQDLDWVRLEWHCVKEWDTEVFDIFRAGADSNFVHIGTVAAAGRSAVGRDYVFYDTLPIPATSYYTVVMRHRNGWDLATDTVAVRFDPTRIVGVYPNPSRDWLNVRVRTDLPEEIYFGLFTGSRQEMLRDRWIHEEGMPHPVDIHALPPGIYFYNVTYSGGSYWGKLVKTDW